MHTLKDLPLADVEGELAISRRVLERLPEDRLSWKPHAKSKSVGELGAHIADVVFTSPKIIALRSFGISHIAHHRGQLSVYLRLLDLPVPSVYGPTADEG